MRHGVLVLLVAGGLAGCGGTQESSLERYQAALTKAGYGLITTEVRPFTDAGPFYYAEAYHQQYLFKNPGGYCNHGFCQVAYDRQDLTRVELPSA